MKTVGVDVIQFESNSPGEDRFCIREKILKCGSPIKAYSVIDGHGGYLAADHTSMMI
jgi:hypothetical protein